MRVNRRRRGWTVLELHRSRSPPESHPPDQNSAIVLRLMAIAEFGPHGGSNSESAASHRGPLRSSRRIADSSPIRTRGMSRLRSLRRVRRGRFRRARAGRGRRPHPPGEARRSRVVGRSSLESSLHAPTCSTPGSPQPAHAESECRCVPQTCSGSRPCLTHRAHYPRPFVARSDPGEASPAPTATPELAHVIIHRLPTSWCDLAGAQSTAGKSDRPFLE